MSNSHYKVPFISLENQYTYLKRKQNNQPNPLLSLSEELQQMKKLPLIQRKYLKTSRKAEKQLLQLEQAINAHKKKPNPLSQHRYLKPNLMPLYLPIPLSIPINLQYVQPIQSLPNKAEPNAPSKQAINIDPKKQTKPQQKREEAIKKAKQIVKFPEKSKLNRFRIVAYAVYFSIYFKYFSKKFTELRRNWFNERYALNDGKIILESSMKILKHLQEVDIYKMLQSAKQKARDIGIEENTNRSTQKGSESIATLIHFVSLLLDYARQYMTAEKFIKEHHQVFTVGVLTQNFMLTNLYLPQQAALLHIHPQGYILVDEETEIILLMLKIIVKIIVYNFLLGLKFSRQWNTKQEKSYGLDDSDMEELWMITRNSGIFLNIACEQIYEKTFKQMQNLKYSHNFNEMSVKFNILPAKSLQEIKQSKTVQNPDDSNSKLIINLDGYSQMKTLIDQSSALRKFKDTIKLKIIDFLTVIYTYLKYEEAQVYDFCRFLTLDQKFIILKGIKQQLAFRKKKKKQKNKKSNKNDYDQNGNKIRKMVMSENNHKGEDENGSCGSSPSKNGKSRDHKAYPERSGKKSEQSNSQDQEQIQEFQGARKLKKMRFKHEQAFFEHKFDGHYKMEKLKKKMKKK